MIFLVMNFYAMKPGTSVILVLLLFTLSCRTVEVSFIETYRKPVVSIDSMFQSNGIRNGPEHAKRLTTVFSKLYDSVSLDGGFSFAANYMRENKIHSTYTMSAVLSPAKYPGTETLVASFRGYMFDHYTKTQTIAFACFSKSEKAWGCFHYDPLQPDSTDYKLLHSSTNLGFIFEGLVPLKGVLDPINNNTSYKSFSMDEFVSSKWSDRKQAANFTHIINNVLVFNQSTYPRRVIRNNTNYRYFRNYNVKKRNRKKSDFQIVVALRANRSSYILDFKLIGEEVNFATMENVCTTITLDKRRILENDYTEATVKISSLIGSFTLHNTVF